MPGEEFGPYRIESQLAQGGMGTVYLAVDSRLGRRVALKLLGRQWLDSADFRARFLRESRLAASLDHPNILPVFEAGEIGDQPYLAMRWVDGHSLGALIERDGAFEPQRALKVVADVASALDAAHAAGLVHRDVKPANILVAETSTGEHAYLSDFGVAKLIAGRPDVTRAGELIGTVAYLAPEQIDGRGVDGRTDVYSLSCVLFELLTGTPPFTGDEPLAVLFAHVHAPRPSLADRRPDVPDQVEQVVARGMAIDPAARFATAGEMASAARLALDGGTLLAASYDAQALRAEAAQAQATVVMPRPGGAMAQPRLTTASDEVASGEVALGAQPAPRQRTDPAAAPAAAPDRQPARSLRASRVRASAGTRGRYVTGATLAALLIVAVLGGLLAVRVLTDNAAQAGASIPASTASARAFAGDASGCEPRSVSAPNAGRWRLWRTEYGARDAFDYLRLQLRREGEHEQTASATVQVASIAEVAAQFDVAQPPEGDVAIVVTFDGPVSIGGPWQASAGREALRHFAISRGREGKVHAVAGVRGDGCFSVDADAWGAGQDAGETAITLQIARP